MSQRAHCHSQVGGHNTGQLDPTHSFVPFQSLGSSNKEQSQCWWTAVNRGFTCAELLLLLFIFLHSSSQCMNMLWWKCKNICVDISYIWLNEWEQRWISSWKESDSALNRWPYTANAFLQCDRLIITLQVLPLVKRRLILTLASSSQHVIKEFLGEKKNCLSCFSLEYLHRWAPSQICLCCSVFGFPHSHLLDSQTCLTSLIYYSQKVFPLDRGVACATAAWPRQLTYSPVWLGESVQFAAWPKLWAEHSERKQSSLQQRWPGPRSRSSSLALSSLQVYPSVLVLSSTLWPPPLPRLSVLLPAIQGPVAPFLVFFLQLSLYICFVSKSRVTNKRAAKTCGHGGHLKTRCLVLGFFLSLSLFDLIWEDKYFWKGFSRFVFRGVGGY